MHTYYVDESGYKGDWAFALVGVCDSGIPRDACRDGEPSTKPAVEEPSICLIQGC